MKKSGLIYAFITFTIWGLLPLYWKTLETLPGIFIFCHRIFWSAVFLFLVMIVRYQGFQQLIFQIRSGLSKILPIFLSASLIAINWFFYIFAINHGHALDASLGYFILPLVSVMLGSWFLGERLSRIQQLSIGIATAAVILLAINTVGISWISLTLAFTFGFYSLVRKKLSIDPLVASFLEALVLAGPAVIYLLWNDSRQEVGAINLNHGLWIGLVFSGVATALPLWLFAEAAKRLPLSTVGFIQYISPTLQLLIAVFIFGETFTLVHLLSYGLIWIALIIFSYSLFRPIPIQRNP